MFEVHISKHSLFSLTKTLSRSRSVVWCVHVACVVCGLCVFMWWLCVWCWWCVYMWCCVWCWLFCGLCVYMWCCVVVCGEAWHTLFPLALALVLSLFLLYSLLATKHNGKNRSTNTAANIEAFECDLAQDKCTAVGSLPPPLPPTPRKKKMEHFYYRNISGEEFIFFTVLN